LSQDYVAAASWYRKAADQGAISQSHYGCSSARNKGTCNNLLTIRRDVLEAKVLDGLKHQLMHPDLVRTFVDEFHRELNRQAWEQDARRGWTTRDLAKTERDIGRLIEAIKAGPSRGHSRQIHNEL
jgi:hypothetical protein